MDSTPSTRQTTPPAVSRKSNPSAWLFVCLIATVAISLAAAHAPVRIRLIGLFSIAFGLLVGWVLKKLAAALDADISPKLMGTVAGLLAAGGLIGSTGEIIRLESVKRAKSPKDNVALRIIEDIESNTEPDKQRPIESGPVAELHKHLAYRLRQLGEWPSPWPEVFWAAELTAGATAAFWIARRSRPATTSVVD